MADQLRGPFSIEHPVPAQNRYTCVMGAMAFSSNWKSAGQLIAIAAMMKVGHLCLSTFCFTHGVPNFIFVCAFFLTPFLALWPVLRLGRRSKRIGVICLTPLLALSSLLLLFLSACGNFGRHPELIHDLSVVQQGGYSVHLERDATGGALAPHGLSVQQRMTIAPGLYLVKYVDYLNEAYDGSLSIEPPDKVRVHITVGSRHSPWEHGGDKTYVLKPHIYF